MTNWFVLVTSAIVVVGVEEYSVEFKKPNLVDMVESFLNQGFSVAYFDCDDRRRENVNFQLHERPYDKLKIEEPKLSGRSTVHYNIVIIVNGYDIDPRVRKELIHIAGCFGGYGACIVEVNI